MGQCNAAPATDGSIQSAHYYPSLNSESLAALTSGASPLLRPCFFSRQHCDFLLSRLQLKYLLCSIRPSCQCSTSALLLSSNVLSPFCSLHPHHHLMFLAISLHLLLPLPRLTPSGFFNGMLTVSEPEVLNLCSFFCLILLTLFVSRN